MLMASSVLSDGGEPFDGVRKSPYQIDQQGCLRVRLCPALLPVFQRADVRAQVGREQCSREPEVLPNADQFPGGDLRRRLELNGVGAQCALTLPCLRQCRHTFAQLREQIALGRTLRLHPCLPVNLLDSSSILSIAFIGALYATCVYTQSTYDNPDP